MPYKNPEDKRRWNREKSFSDSWYRHLAAERQRRYRARKKRKAARDA